MIDGYPANQNLFEDASLRRQASWLQEPSSEPSPFPQASSKTEPA